MFSYHFFQAPRPISGVWWHKCQEQKTARGLKSREPFISVAITGCQLQLQRARPTERLAGGDKAGALEMMVQGREDKCQTPPHPHRTVPLGRLRRARWNRPSWKQNLGWLKSTERKSLALQRAPFHPTFFFSRGGKTAFPIWAASRGGKLQHPSACSKPRDCGDCSPTRWRHQGGEGGLAGQPRSPFC